jgi:hypothetical protein
MRDNIVRGLFLLVHPFLHWHKAIVGQIWSLDLNRDRKHVVGWIGRQGYYV